MGRRASNERACSETSHFFYGRGGAIFLAALVIAASVIAHPFVRRYEVTVQRGGVVRTDRISGEVVICDQQGCYRLIEAGPLAKTR